MTNKSNNNSSETRSFHNQSGNSPSCSSSSSSSKEASNGLGEASEEYHCEAVADSNAHNNNNNNNNKEEEDEEPLSSWVIPSGAEIIIKQLCAQELLQQLLDGRLETMSSSPFSTTAIEDEDEDYYDEYVTAEVMQDPTTATILAPDGLPPVSQPSHLHGQHYRQQQPEEPPPPVDFETVRYLIENYPGICRSVYQFRWEGGDTRYLYPLAMLCLLQPPLDLVQLAYKAYPQALTIAEPTKGCIPLHYACSAESSLELVSFLLDQKPETIQTKRFDGMLPLHLASYFRAPLCIVEFLHSHYPAALHAVDHEEWTPLHAAARGNAPVAVVQRLYHWRPESALCVDEARRTPLHLACMKRGDSAVVTFLYQAAPAAMSMEDIHNLTPLFHAAKCQTVETLQRLLQLMAPLARRPPPQQPAQEEQYHHQEQEQEQEQQAAMENDEEEEHAETLDHMQIRNNYDDDNDNDDRQERELIRTAAAETNVGLLLPPQLPLQEQQPAVQQWLPPSDHLGATLLHFAVAANTPTVVQYLCQTYPSLAEARCTERMRYTALHVACLCDAPVANVQMLLQRHPWAIQARTGQGHDCLYIARKSRASWQLIELLERAMIQQST
ncbi:hypothetical protein ACA910_012022 [Epithemia clementina (nom. ined.)]